MTDDEREKTLAKRPMKDDFDHAVPCTDDDLVFLRTRAEADIHRNYPSVEINNWTCDGCDQRYTCVYVYDPYNTDGDCLASK